MYPSSSFNNFQHMVNLISWQISKRWIPNLWLIMSCFSFPKINTQKVLEEEGPPASFGMSPSFLREKARFKRGPIQSHTEGIEKKGLEPGSPGSKLRALPYRLASPRHQNACLVPTPKQPLRPPEEKEEVNVDWFGLHPAGSMDFVSHALLWPSYSFKGN